MRKLKYILNFNFSHIFSLFLGLSLMCYLSGCQNTTYSGYKKILGNGDDDGGSTGQDGLDTGSGSDDGGTDLEADAGTTGLAIKNFEQVYTGMWEVTGLPKISSDHANIINFFNVRKTRYPVDANASNFLPIHVIMLGNLATKFCTSLIDNSAGNYPAQPNFFAGTPYAIVDTDSDHKPSVFLSTSEQREALVETMLEKIWYFVPQESSLYSEAKSELLMATDDLIPLVQNNSGGTRQLMQALCAILLSSGPMMYQ